MPNIYAKYHDQFIEKFLNVLELKVLDREKSFLGKNKMNFIFKMNFKIKVKFFYRK